LTLGSNSALAGVNLSKAGYRFSGFCTTIFNISGEFIEVFFHNLFNYGLVGEVWFYFFITYREMKVRLHFQFLAYKAG